MAFCICLWFRSLVGNPRFRRSVRSSVSLRPPTPSHRSDGRPHAIRVVISAHQCPSTLNRAHRSSSAALISGAHLPTRSPYHQGQSRAIKANQGQSRAIKRTFPQDLLIFVAQSPQALTKLEAQQRRGCEVVHVKELCHRNELVSVPDEGGNQASSEAIRGHLEAIESNQWQSVATSPRTGGRASRCL